MNRVGVLLLLFAGCSAADQSRAPKAPLQQVSEVSVAKAGVLNQPAVSADDTSAESSSDLQLVAFEGAGSDLDAPPPLPESDEVLLAPIPLDGEEAIADADTLSGDMSLTLPDVDAFGPPLMLEAVIDSVYATYPLLAAAITDRQRAFGERVAASGAFDTNLDVTSINQPLSFYENYRHDAVVSRNLYGGGSVFGKYRNGRGDFEPWYQERVTEDGGEFSAGIIRPLKRGRDIDARRAELWRAAREQVRVDPLIRTRLITFVLDGSVAYWQWVAAGQRADLARSLVEIAETRVQQVKRRVELGDLDPPVEPENERLLLSRRATLLAAEAGVERAAASLSLFYRDVAGNPVIPDAVRLPDQTQILTAVPDPMADLPAAIAARPEIAVLTESRRQASITLAEAQNRMLPRLDASGLVKQDFGGKASKSDDKQPLELEAGVLFNLPLERRRAKGDILKAQATLARLASERRFATDRVFADLTRAAASIEAAVEQVRVTERSVELAAELARVERRRFELGESSLLEVTIREQQLAEATESVISSRLTLGIALAEYRAALAVDRLPE